MCILYRVFIESDVSSSPNLTEGNGSRTGWWIQHSLRHPRCYDIGRHQKRPSEAMAYKHHDGIGLYLLTVVGGKEVNLLVSDF